jgi:hypothetical protein
MLSRRYEIISIRPSAGELLIRYVEADHDIVLNLASPADERDLHRHILRHWPRDRFRAMRTLTDLARANLGRTVKISAAEVEMFGLEEIDE